MGQKTHPYGFRLGIVKDWKSRWYAESKDFPRLLHEDETLRKYLNRRLGHAAISKIEIERKPSKLVVTLHTARPGVVIGKKGAEVDKLRDELSVVTNSEVSVNVEEIKRPEVDAALASKCFTGLNAPAQRARGQRHSENNGADDAGSRVVGIYS